jgi:hypothetical protein
VVFIILLTNGLYYKHTTIVNYASRIVNKQKALLTDNARLIIYDRRVFIVQAASHGLLPKLQIKNASSIVNVNEPLERILAKYM